MSPPAGYTEWELVQKPAIDIFKDLEYQYVYCKQEIFGPNGTLGREDMAEVVLKPRLKSALTRLNRELPATAIEEAIEQLTADRSTLNPIIANREVYRLIRDGVKVKVKKESSEDDIETVKVIDLENPENNDFLLAAEFWVLGEMYKRRADLVGFVNGLPLIFIELKATHRRLKNAYTNNLLTYKSDIPQMFWYNAFIILSNGTQSKAGTVSSEWEHFLDWKKISNEGERGVISLDTIIKGMCQKQRFFDLFENFLVYMDPKGSLIKILARNHQYLGVNRAIKSFEAIQENEGKLGVFWHTQGSGKSISMIFFSQKILRKYQGNYTFVIVTDREELDGQIYENFSSAGAVTEDKVHASSSEHLRRLLKEDHRNIFTLIHKFRPPKGMNSMPALSTRDDIIVIADEAHRSQYDDLAKNMRIALPNAAFIAFTATPLIASEEQTRRTFGDYVSIYNFKESIDDGATVPLFYEVTRPDLRIVNEKLANELAQAIDDAGLDEAEEEKLQQEFSQVYQAITRDPRLENIAEDIVYHYMNRGYLGKAMVVCIDKFTTVKLYDKVQKYWKQYLKSLNERVSKTTDGNEKFELENLLHYMEITTMAVVISPDQNEVSKFRKHGLDIASHRKKMNDEDLKTKFKDADDPFRIVFVCAKWLTGFDAPSLSTIYLDKPMKNHTLMQAIARANRVFENKPNGTIVDYFGVFRNLREALAIYGTDARGGMTEGEIPVKPKAELVDELEAAIAEAKSFCSSHKIELKKIIDSKGIERTRLIGDAVDTFLSSEEIKKAFAQYAATVKRLYKAVLPDPIADEYADIYILLRVISEQMKTYDPEIEIEETKRQIEGILDKSVKVQQHIDILANQFETHQLDLSKLDSEKLKNEFLRGRKHIQSERLKQAVSIKLNQMARKNKTRLSFLEKYQQMLDKYNSGETDIELLFNQLVLFAQELNEEEQRTIAENLTEEELAIFDLLYKPDLTRQEKQVVKKAAKKLIQRLKEEKIVLDWRKRQQTRAAMKVAIKEILNELLPESYEKPLFDDKCGLVYQHIFESYAGPDESIYVEASMN